MKDVNNQLSQYIISRQKKIFRLFEKGRLVIQAYNDNDNIKVYLQNNTQVYIQIALDINQNFYIQLPFKQILLLGSLSDMPKVSTTWFATYYLYYKEKSGITESAYNLFLLQLSCKRISLFSTLFNYIVIIIKPFYVMLEADKHWFTIYYHIIKPN